MNEESPKFVRHVPGPMTQEQIDRMRELAARPDSDIDFSDIPELDDAFFENAKQGTMYRLVKKQTTLRLDADILDWFKRHARDGKGYQTDINKALRAYMVAQDKRAAKTPPR